MADINGSLSQTGVNFFVIFLAGPEDDDPALLSHGSVMRGGLDYTDTLELDRDPSGTANLPH